MASETEKEVSKPAKGHLGEDENNAIFLAVKGEASLRELEQLINQREDWETTDQDGNTIVHVAAEVGNLEALKCFLEKGAAVDARNKYDSTPLLKPTKACRNFMQIVNLLVENGADIQAVNVHGCNVLFYAAKDGQSLEDLEELERRGVPWNISSKYDILHSAVESGNLKVLKHFITKGIDVNGKDEVGVTPLIKMAQATITNFPAVVDFLVDNGADLQAVDKYGHSVLHNSLIHDKPISHLKFLVGRGSAWDKPNNAGQSIIHLAAETGNLEAIEYFISLGARVNSRCKNGFTPLFMALHLPTQIFFQTVELLVRNGTDVNADTDDQLQKITVLHYAAKKGDIEKCKYLISLGADVNAENKNGATPIMYACPENASAVVKALVDLGADIRQTDRDKFTLIDHLVNYGVTGTELDALVEMGARYDTCNRYGNSVLHLAASSGNLEALRYFLSRGLDANGRNANGWTPLLNFRDDEQENFQEVAEILVKNGADVNAVDDDGENAVLLGLENGLDKSGVEKLIALGCCWWCPSKKGETVFHRITADNNAELLEYFLSLRNELTQDFMLT